MICGRDLRGVDWAGDNLFVTDRNVTILNKNQRAY